MTTNKFYITTPIYYATARPHVGSLYSTLLADVYARWYRAMGKNTFLLVGTDEHGQKIATAAHQAGKDPKSFVDEFIGAYQDTWKKYNISYNHFIRTTDQEHMKGAQAFVQKLLDTGDIYPGTYEGWYCVQCETFLPQTDNTLDKPACPTCGRKTEWLAETTYFFRLSAYQEKLLNFYQKNPYFIAPKERAHEVISFVQAGLKDLSISRTSVSWGIQFPHDPAHVIYVWVEALSNYITAIGYGNKARAQEFAYWWPANMQVLGKDIIRFHAVFWPAFLMAAELPLPQQLLVHGWIIVNQEKMSKSKGNVIDPHALLATYDADAIRYYLCRNMAVNQDGDFSIPDLEKHIASDLANDLGNLLNRMILLAEKHGLSVITPPATWSIGTIDLRDNALTMFEEAVRYIEDRSLHLALAAIWKFIHEVNAYFHVQEPWKQLRTDVQAFHETLSATCHGLWVIGHVLWPVMPRKMETLLASLGTILHHKQPHNERIAFDVWHHTFILKNMGPLFVKPDQKSEQIAELNTTEHSKQMIAEQSYIALEDFMKCELRVGTIISCERIAQSDKMLKLQVDFGSVGKRQILTNIGTYYAPEELRGKQVAFIINLKPRKMLGLESQGMILTIDNNDATGKPELMQPAHLVHNGSRLK